MAVEVEPGAFGLFPLSPIEAPSVRRAQADLNELMCQSFGRWRYRRLGQRVDLPPLDAHGPWSKLSPLSWAFLDGPCQCAVCMGGVTDLDDGPITDPLPHEGGYTVNARGARIHDEQRQRDILDFELGPDAATVTFDHVADFRSAAVAAMGAARRKPREIEAGQLVPGWVRARSKERWRREHEAICASQAEHDRHPIRNWLREKWQRASKVRIRVKLPAMPRMSFSLPKISFRLWPRRDRFPPGTVVWLKAGSTPMTVARRNCDMLLECDWFDRNGHLKHDRFYDKMLTKRRRPLPPSNSEWRRRSWWRRLMGVR